MKNKALISIHVNQCLIQLNIKNINNPINKWSENILQKGNVYGQQAREKLLNAVNHQGHANQNHKRYHLTPFRMEWLLSKRIQITNVGEDVEKWECLSTVGRSVIWCCHCGKQSGGFLKS